MTNNPLAVIEKLPAASIFGAKEGESQLDAILEQIRKAATSVPVDVSTKAGREACASLAYKVARSKTYLDNLGKDLTEASRAYVAGINADRKKATEYLDALRDEVRKPLNDYEAREAKRVEGHKAELRNWEAQLEEIRALPLDEEGLAALTQMAVPDASSEADLSEWEEFSAQAELLFLKIGKESREKLAAIEKAISARKAAEAAEAERQRLAAIEAARVQAEREAAIAAEAKAKAEQEAAAAIKRAQEEAQASKRRAEEAEAKAKQDAADAIARANAQAEKAKRDAEEAEKRRIEEAARVAAIEQKRREQAILEATQRAEAAAQEKARQEEQERLKAKEDAERIERARQQDKENRRKVNREALEDMALKFADLFDSEEAAQAAARTVLEAIITGHIRHVTVNY